MNARLRCASRSQSARASVNESMCKLLRRDRDELLGISWTELTHPDDAAAESALARGLTDRRPPVLEKGGEGRRNPVVVPTNGSLVSLDSGDALLIEASDRRPSMHAARGRRGPRR